MGGELGGVAACLPKAVTEDPATCDCNPPSWRTDQAAQTASGFTDEHCSLFRKVIKPHNVS